MKMQRMSIVGAYVMMLGLVSVSQAQLDSTDFTWQGVLIHGFSYLEGQFDLRFRLFPVPEGGSQVGVDSLGQDVAVSEGVFCGVLDFGVDIADGQPWYLEIAFRLSSLADPYPYTVLDAPRQGVIRTHHTIVAEAVSIGRNLPQKKLTVLTTTPGDGLLISSGPVNSTSLALLCNMNQGAWNSLTQKGDNMLLWKGQGPDDPGAGGLVIAPWGPTSAGIRVTPEGNVGIGVKFPAAKLEVGGDIQCASLYESSDERFKTNVVTLSSALDKVEKLRGVSFEWNDKAESVGAQAGQKQIGVVAQEVESVFPELVASATDGYKAVDYTKLTAVLIEAVKELKTENEGLKKRLEALENTLE